MKHSNYPWTLGIQNPFQRVLRTSQTQIPFDNSSQYTSCKIRRSKNKTLPEHYTSKIKGHNRNNRRLCHSVINRLFESYLMRSLLRLLDFPVRLAFLGKMAVECESTCGDLMVFSLNWLHGCLARIKSLAKYY